MQKKHSATDIVREYSDQYPDMGHSQLAHFIFNKYKKKGLFSSAENVRSLVRYVRGKRGNVKNKNDRHRHETEKRSSAPYKCPKGDSEKIEPFHIPIGHNNLLILSDIHVPYHDERALELAVKHGKDKGVNGVLINGDLIDFYAISHFLKDPRKTNLSHEIEQTIQVLQYLRDSFKNTPIWYAPGNHCRRWELWLMSQAPVLLGIPYFDMSAVLKLNDIGITLLEDKQKVMAGKLTILHGDTLLRGFGTAVSPARNIFMKTNESVLAGHCHKTSEYTAPSMNGGITTCWTTGCLCDLEPAYNPHINGYNHGFAIVEFDKDGTFRVDNIRIHDYKIL